MKVLLGYASAHGSTAEIALKMQEILKAHNLDVDVRSVEEVDALTGYDAFIGGTAVQGGFWLPPMSRFVQKHRESIARMPFYFFVTCIRVLEADAQEHVNAHYLRRDLLQAMNVRRAKAFAGRLLLNQIDWNERWTLALQYDGRLTAEHYNGDYRDWLAISRWTETVASELRQLASRPTVE